MKRRSPLLFGILASAAVLALPGEGRACGGAFSSYPAPGQDPEQITVAAQRMAFSISPTQSVLWSQIRYKGDPSEFAWVIPVGPGATIEASTDAWFEALEAATGTQVVAPSVTCYDDYAGGDGSSGCACGSEDAAGAAYDNGGSRTIGGEDTSVSVLHSGSVGPYDTVTLDTSNGEALQQWLADHGYAVPPEVVPVLDAYAAEGLDFIALRLSGGAGLDKMTPVRIVAPGGSPIIPIRMMVAGAAEKVPVTLYVFGEGRYETDSYPSVALSLNGLVWDFNTERSNYTDLRDQALAEQDGRGFLTTFAMGKAISSQLRRPGGQPAEVTVGGGAAFSTLADLYFAQGGMNAGVDVSACPTATSFNDGGDLEVVEACDEGGGPTEPCVAPPGAAPRDFFSCGELTDLGVALTGMRSNDVWITRLEADLPVTALTEDLSLKAASSQATVSNWHVAKDVTNVPCGEWDVEPTALSARGVGGARTSAGMALMLIAAVGSVFRRRPRR